MSEATNNKAAPATDDGGPAFPLQSIGPDFAPGYAGMTLRDWFAGQALAGMNASLTSASDWPRPEHIEVLARHAYKQADAMLTARKRERQADA